MVQNERRSTQIRFGLCCVFMQNCNPYTHTQRAHTHTAYTHALSVGEHCLMPKANKTARPTAAKGLRARGAGQDIEDIKGEGAEYVERANVRLCVAKFRIYIFISRIAAANMRHMAIEAISQAPKERRARKRNEETC